MDDFLSFYGSNADSLYASVFSNADKHEGCASLVLDGLDPNELKRLCVGEFAAKVKIDVDGSTLKLDVDWGNVRRSGRKPKVYLEDSILFRISSFDERHDPDFRDGDREALAKIYEIGAAETARRLGVSRSTVYRYINRLKDEMDRLGEPYDDLDEAYGKAAKDGKK